MNTKAYSELKKKLPDNVILVAVSKTKPISDIQILYDLGHRDFGENKVQELVDKYEKLPKDIRWHMIGHLQTNKVKYIASFIHIIHSVDSLKLLQEIDKRAKKNNRIINCLLQIKIAQEATKYGFSQNEILTLFENSKFKEFEYVNIRGLMGMATNTDDKEQVYNEFKELHNLFFLIKDTYMTDNKSFTLLSMGMSNDYQEALKAGSNMVRIGSLIFGKRNYIH